MSTLYTVFLIAATVCAIGCLFRICRAIEKLSRGIFSIRRGLTELNTKLESMTTASREDSKTPKDEGEPDISLKTLEAAVSNFEKMKRL